MATPSATSTPAAATLGTKPARISLLEVMISIGVVGIGLIGVAALIPLAHHKAAEGVREDRKAAMGRRAFREFRVRAMDQPGTATQPYWVWPKGAYPFSIYGPTGLNRKAYCLDPLAATTFPSFPAGGSIPRVSLYSTRVEDVRRSFPANDAANILRNNGLGLVMTPGQADEIFRLQDDLVFEKPENKNDPPFQVFLDNNKRLSSGGYSWMATIVPDKNPRSDRWVLSVVVFHRRKLIVDPTKDPPQELMVPVAYPLVTDLDKDSGLLMNTDVKEVHVPVKQASTLANRDQASVRHIKTGDWVMLTQQRTFVGTNIPYHDMKWYRVTAASELQTEKATVRDLLLSGSDWERTSVRGATLFLVYVRDVVAVFEKTIRMNDGGMHAW